MSTTKESNVTKTTRVEINDTINCTEPRVLQATEIGNVNVLDICADLPSMPCNSSLFHRAIINRLNNSIELLCERYSAENRADCNGEFPMNLALRLQHFDIADLLVEHCSANYLQPKNIAPHDTSAHEAARNGTNGILMFLDNKKIMYQDQRNDLGQIPIMLAVQHFRKDTIQYLFDKGARAFQDFEDNAGNTILYYTACNPSLTAVEYYLQTDYGGFNLRKANKAVGETVLFAAVKCNNLHLVKYLVANNNATLDMYTCDLENPLMAAVKNDSLTMVEYLVSHPLKTPFRKDKYGNRAPDYWKSEGMKNFFRTRFPSIAIKSSVNSKYDCNQFNYTIVTCGDIDFLQYCANERENLLDFTTEDQKSLAHYAAEADQQDVLQWLLQQKTANFVNRRDVKDNTILHVAASVGAARAVNFIASWTNSTVFLLKTNAAGFTALHVAAAKGHDAVAKILVSQWHVSPGIRTTFENDTAALVAIREKHDNLSLWFLSQEPSIAAAIGKCRTNMLHWATNVGTAFTLCNKYGVRGVSDCKGDYPIHLAFRKLNFQLVDVLISECDEYLLQDKTVSPGGTVAHEAAKMGQLNILTDLDKRLKGARSNRYEEMKNDDGETPIFLAVDNNHFDIVEHIACNTTAHVKTVDSKGNTIIHRLACRSNSDGIFKCLKEHWYSEMRSTMKEKNKEGQTVLYRATTCDNLKLVRDLLTEFSDADITTPASDNTTPLMVAMSRDNYEMVQFILALEHQNRPTNAGSAWAPWEYAKNDKMKDFVRNHYFNVTNTSSQQSKVLSKRESRTTDRLDYPLQIETWNKSANVSIWESGFLTNTILLLDTILKKIFGLKSNHGSDNSDIPLSPPEVLQNKIDPLALKAVLQADHFEDLDDDDENDGK